MIKIEKKIVDGKVGVLYHEGYGGGWADSYDRSKELQECYLYDSVIVEYVMEYSKKEWCHFIEDNGIPNEICRKIIKRTLDFDNLGEELVTIDEIDYYINNRCKIAKRLKIEWVPVGKLFKIHEYDGSERIMLYDDETYYTA